MNRQRRWLAFGTVAVLGGGLGAWSAWRHYAPGEAELDVAELLYALNLPDSQGLAISLDQFRGQPLVVNFWATWCPPCIEEMPELSELQLAYQDRKLQILGLGIDSPDAISKFAGKLPVSYPLLVAGVGGAELSRRFGNRGGGLPYTVVIDRTGRVMHSILGRFRTPDLRRAIDAVVA